MASSTYLQLTNRVLNAFNEVELNSTTFGSSLGFNTEAKNAINQGLFDVYSYESTKWPFLFATQTFTATRGVYNYTPSASITDIDWNSFVINRQQYTITVTQTGGVATATVSGGHTAQTGDLFYIDGADQSGYNKPNAGVTVLSSTQFTYLVDSGTVSPATGTIIAKSNTVQWHKLAPDDINAYRLSIGKEMENLTSDNFDTPRGVVKTQDNKIILFPAPDRTYSISYDSFVIPAGLSAYSDTHLVPEQYEQAIVDFALHYAYMFRDNPEEATLATKRAEDRIRRMRKALIPVQENVNWG